jgi:archaellum component FlaD/FlaE
MREDNFPTDKGYYEFRSDCDGYWVDFPLDHYDVNVLKEDNKKFMKILTFEFQYKLQSHSKLKSEGKGEKEKEKIKEREKKPEEKEKERKREKEPKEKEKIKEGEKKPEEKEKEKELREKEKEESIKATSGPISFAIALRVYAVSSLFLPALSAYDSYVSNMKKVCYCYIFS